MNKHNKIQLFQNGCGKWQYRVRWANGEIGLCSEMYTTKHGASKSALKMLTCVTTDKYWKKWHYEVIE